jgi:hypothetical protein
MGPKKQIAEMMRTGRYIGIGSNEFTALLQEIEELIGLDDYYQVEADTVEK